MIYSLFDGEFSRLAFSADGFVDLAIRSTTDETYDLVAIVYVVLVPVALPRHGRKGWGV
jgi:hypothetical protein